MTYLKHCTSTLFFSLFSPFYLLYILILFLISPFGLVFLKIFKRDTSRKLSTADYIEPDLDYSLHEVFTANGVRRIAATMFFALLSPIYMIYIVGLVLIAPIGLMLSRVSKVEYYSDSFRRKLKNRSIMAHSFHA